MFGMLLLGVSTSSLSNARAASDYNMKTTTLLRLRGTSPAGDCGPEEQWNTRWTDFMSQDTSNNNSYRNTWNYQSGYDNARYTMDSFHDEFESNVTTGSGWAVQHQKAGYAGTGQAITLYTFDPGATLTVVNGAVQASSGYVHYETFGYNPNAGCRWQALDYNSNGSNHYIFNVSADAPLMLVASTNIVYPSDYAGTPLPTSLPSPRNYVALGDSFSSGEGNPPFETGTDIGSGDNKNQCHRSASAYPHLLASVQYLSLTSFVACSGATTTNVISGGTSDGAWREPPQISALSQDTDIATITVGGDDVGFRDFATACTISLCDFSTQAYTDIHDKIINELPSKLVATYHAIDQATSDTAKIYVLGYSMIAPAQMPIGANSACWPLNGGVNNPDPTLNNGATAYAVETQLNNAIQQAVTSYGSPKFQYVDLDGVNSPFTGHDWCSQERYFNQVTLNQTSYSYHPNILGHEAYEAVVSTFMDQQ